MLTETLIPIASTVFSAIALIVSLVARSSNLRMSRNVQHYNHAAKAEGMLADNKACLRFHGINPDKTEEDYGVNSAEVAYLLQLFNAGSISNLLSRDGHKKPFKEGSYWYAILDNEHTQNAFPLIKLLFNPKNSYIARCGVTIRAIKDTDTSREHSGDTSLSV